MKTFKEYLAESKKLYDFKIKIAGEFAAEDKLKEMLARYVVSSFKKTGTTPIQALPLDFPKIRNSQVTVYEVALEYPTTPYELHEYISAGLEKGPDYVVVRKPGEPTEAYQLDAEMHEGALLQDPNYTEVAKIDTKDYYGTEYNTSLVKTLNDDLKAMRKERGEVIPSTVEGKTTNDIPQNNQSPLQQTDYDPRKK
jgi:hypothetical protein